MSVAIKVLYFARLREERGCQEEKVDATGQTVGELYQNLKMTYGLSVAIESLRVAINEEFCSWDTPLKAGDEVAFIPPVAGG